jgi:3-deoxy-D-manno-octulosonate 8-phosphate phosphatase (KDO 8-P phosphatase)
MITGQQQILSHFKGKFLTEPVLFLQKLARIKAYLFDWDGVFNDGFKDANGSSPYSEIDAMGTNLLRYNHYLRQDEVPAVAILSGEKNAAGFALARREHFDGVYFKIMHKADALMHFCKRYSLQPQEVAFVFDDVLDFSAAALCGLRIMVSRPCNPLLIDFAVEKGLVDYLTSADGGHHAIRETSELLCALRGNYEETIDNRMQFTDHYQHYLKIRNQPDPFFCTMVDAVITEQANI